MLATLLLPWTTAVGPPPPNPARGGDDGPPPLLSAVGVEGRRAGVFGMRASTGEAAGAGSVALDDATGDEPAGTDALFGYDAVRASTSTSTLSGARRGRDSDFAFVLEDPREDYELLPAEEPWVRSVEGELAFSSGIAENRVGVQLRDDVIDNRPFDRIGRQRISAGREGAFRQTSLGMYAESRIVWNDWFTSTIGARGELYHFDVTAESDADAGNANDSVLSPTAGVVMGPWAETELFLRGGLGFDNDGSRDLGASDEPDPLVRQQGAEIGVRTAVVDGLESTLSAWYLERDSEQLFAGNADGTATSSATERYGVGWTNLYRATDWLALDLDLVASRARTRNPGAEGPAPEALDAVAALGATLSNERGDSLSLRGRYFGSRELSADGSLRSSPSFHVDAHAEWRVSDRWTLRLSALNLLDRDASDDIEYFYPSRSADGPAGVGDAGFNDAHFHPAEPFSVLLTLTAYL